MLGIHTMIHSSPLILDLKLIRLRALFQGIHYSNFYFQFFFLMPLIGDDFGMKYLIKCMYVPFFTWLMVLSIGQPQLQLREGHAYLSL